MRVTLPYGREEMALEVPDERVAGVLVSQMTEYRSRLTQEAWIEQALAHPIGSSGLRDLARGKRKVVVIASDHTRPVPSQLLLPPMLREIRLGNPLAEITILVATGCHRGSTHEELKAKFGTLVEKEHIVIHDCDASPLTKLGTLPSGGECWIHSLVASADLVVAEGFIEPHFFAGFSGGRKSVLPGVAGRATVLANHCAEFIASPYARTGILSHNPIHRDMLWAAKQAKLAFILNVALNAQKEIIYAVAGDCEAAHQEGCAFVSSICRVSPVPAEIVITSNGGYPLDQNIYQAVKGMTAAEASVVPGGVIIMMARANDGHGGEGFYHQLADEPDLSRTLNRFLERDRQQTQPDQWQTQVLIRVLQRASVILVSEAPDEMVRCLHMTPAHSLEEAMALAKRRVSPNHRVTVIPDGVSVIVGGK